jgi:transcription factor IIIB 90 kDa subunit
LGLPGTSLEEYDESTETDKFIGESTISVINECLTVDADGLPKKSETAVKAEAKPVIVAQALGLKPDLLALCTVSEKEQASLSLNKTATEVIDDLNLEGLDDAEIDGYILTESEAVLKDRLWNKMNAEYLKIAKEREERAAREREEGKPEKKKRRSRKKPIGPSSTALDAIQKVLQEKKISSKINYDILKSLTEPMADDEVVKPEEETADVKPVIIDESHLSRPSTSRKSQFNLSNNRRSKVPPQIGFPMTGAETETEEEGKAQTVVETGKTNSNQTFMQKIYLNFILR